MTTGFERDGIPCDEDLGLLVTEVVPEAKAVYLFGSRAAGSAVRSSDVDLAVLASKPVDSGRLARAREALAERLRCDVDLIDLTRSSTVMQAQVIATSRLLRDADPLFREQFEMCAYSAYARLNEERRGILDRIEREGRIHGG